MKLTKGKIPKYLLKDKQSKKKYNMSKITNTNANANTNTNKKRRPLNLKNKTIKHFIYK